MIRRKQASAQDIAAQKRAALKDKTRQSTETVLAKIESGKLVDDCVQDMKKFGKNEFGDILKWDEPGFEEVIRLVADLRISRKYVSGASQRYKAIERNTQLSTPSGYRKAKDIRENDFLIDINGKPTKVIGVHPQPKKDTFKVSFGDGQSQVVCGEHLMVWYNYKKRSKAESPNFHYEVETLEELRQHIEKTGYRNSKGSYIYYVPSLRNPIEFSSALDITENDAYAIGLMIGDGSYKGDRQPCLHAHPDDAAFYSQYLKLSSRRPRKDVGISYEWGFSDFRRIMKVSGLVGCSREDKYIPENLLTLNIAQRKALLAGLMDSDGYTRKGASQTLFDTISIKLANDVATLVRDLGGYAKINEEKRNNPFNDKPAKNLFRVTIALPFNPFKLPRKVANWQPYRKLPGRYITNIEYEKEQESVCFTIEHHEHIFMGRGNQAIHNTAVCAQVNAYLSQRAGLRGLWSFPKARTMELLVPKQHKNLMRNWAKVAGVTKITRDMMTSNAQFDVGLGSATFTHVNSGSGNAAAGASVVAVTADYVFAEEASQSSHQEILPLYRRVDASRISSRPVTWLGTPGGGGGIEAKISDCTYEFWPHAKCPHCEKWVSLHPLGALLRSKTARADDGTLITLWAHEDGTPLDWFHHDPEDPIGSAFVGCVECGKELTDESRIAAKYKCVRTGLFMMEFLNDVVPEVWKEEQLEVGVWVGALARPRRGIAKEIMLEMNPEGIDDWYQQRLGIPSSAMANSIPKEALMNACMRSPFKPSGEEKVIRLLGIDQGRSAWYGAVVEFVYNPNLPPAAMYHSAKRNILALECFPYMATGEFVEKFEVEGGIIDNEPSISAAAAICRATGLKLGDQQARLKDDYQIKMAKDGGEQFECFSLKYKKFFRFIFSMFAGSSVSVRREYLRYASGKVKAPGDIFKHLCRIEWDAENGDVVKAKDGVDDLAFALMFAEAAFCIYTVNPGIISREGYSWDWYNYW